MTKRDDKSVSSEHIVSFNWVRACLVRFIVQQCCFSPQFSIRLFLHISVCKKEYLRAKVAIAVFDILLSGCDEFRHWGVLWSQAVTQFGPRTSSIREDQAGALVAGPELKEGGQP